MNGFQFTVLVLRLILEAMGLTVLLIVGWALTFGASPRDTES
jgi:hypothetical protein